MPRVRGHVFGAGHVHASPADVTGHAGVRLRAQLPSRHRGHALDALENDLRTHRAVEPNDVRPPFVQPSRHVFGGRTVRCVVIRPDRHLRDDRHRRVGLSRGADRFLDLVQIAERLEDEKVSASFLERDHLFTEDGASLFLARRTIGLEPDPERPDRSGDEHRVARFVRDLAGDCRCRAIDRVHLRLEPVLRELDAIRAEAVRLQHLRARFDVLAMDVANEIW